MTILEILDLRGHERIVDVGCGTGQHLRAIASRGHRGQLVGIDLSPEALRRISPSIAFRFVGDASRLSVRDGVADVVLAISVLHLVADIEGAITELRRIVSPSGRLVIMLLEASEPEQLLDLWDRAISEAAGRQVTRAETPLSRFDPDNAISLLRHPFTSVEVHQSASEALLNDPRLVRASAEARPDLYETALLDPSIWRQGMDNLERDAARVVAESGGIVLRSRPPAQTAQTMGFDCERLPQRCCERSALPLRRCMPR